MELSRGVQPWADLEPTPSNEALRLIVEVFRDGHAAAADLRRTAWSLTPLQLELEIEEIEQSMLSEIQSICDNYRIQKVVLPRH